MQLSLLDGFLAVGASSLSYWLYVSTACPSSAPQSAPGNIKDNIDGFKHDQREDSSTGSTISSPSPSSPLEPIKSPFGKHHDTNGHENPSVAAKGYVVINRVAHTRFLPQASKHAFVYPTLTFFLDIDALDKGNLNLGQLQFGSGGSDTGTSANSNNKPKNIGHALLFGVGSRSWTRVTKVRSSSYLMNDGIEGRTFRSRLQEFMSRNEMDELYRQFEDVWLMTSPSYLGYEGINPLSVWYCYGRDKHLLVVLLEVHNTFGERHVYILRTGVNEDASKPKGIDHQWTIPREFHVSPFNDRSGYYTCSLSNVDHPHTRSFDPDTSTSLPKIRLNLLTTNKELKLTAIMTAVESQTLTAKSLLGTFTRYPFLLFLSLVRITFHAMILHYEKRLDVYPRPEPVSSAEGGNGGRSWLRHSWNVPQSYQGPISPPEDRNGGSSNTTKGDSVGWQKEDWLQRAARKRINRFLSWRAEELGYCVELIPANPLDWPISYGFGSGSTSNSTTQQDVVASSGTEDRSKIKAGSISKPKATQPNSNKLTIYYNTPLFFTYLLVLPSATHALLLGCKVEGIFNVSDEELFLEVFEPVPSTKRSRAQEIRRYFLPSTAPPLPCPPTHFLDRAPYQDRNRGSHSGGVDTTGHSFGATWNMTSSIGLIVAYYCLEWIERCLYTLFNARFVEGMEPWNAWGRLRLLRNMMEESDGKDKRFGVGSVNGGSIGSVRRD